MHEWESIVPRAIFAPVDRATSDMDVPAVLASLALSQPDTSAILAPGRPPLSFSRLYAQLEYVRTTLGGWGIERGDPVAVLLPKGPEMATACAILPAAATCIPLDPNSVAADYARLFSRCAARALIVPPDAEHAAVQAADEAGIMRIELAAERAAPAGEFALTLARHATAAPDASPCGPDIAYILCTSGTTAQRKLVPIGHRKITGYSAAAKDFYGFVPDDRGLHIVPHYLSHGLKAALMVPLLAGTSIVCPPDFDIDTVFGLFESHRPTWLTCGFTMHREILRNIDRYRHIVENTSLRFLRAGSGKLEEHEIAALEDAFGAPVIVKLSSTETCLISATPLGPGQRKPGSVGKPLVNEVAVRDPDGRILGQGEEGEIVVRGPLVFEGYIDDPALTRESFVDGWYRTGDLGRIDGDGYLFLTGRIKDMINRGGEKISPAEIDSVLESHPAVAAAAAFGIPHPTLGELVVAAVIPAPDATVDEKEVRDHARARLAPTRVPSRIFVVDRLPRTESGKLQRARLKETFAPQPARP